MAYRRFKPGKDKAISEILPALHSILNGGGLY